MGAREEMKRFQSRLEQIPGEISAIEKRIADGQAKQESTAGRVKRLRGDRQALLVDGNEKGLPKLNGEISAAELEGEIAEDLVAGLEKRIASLQAEEGKLKASFPAVARRCAAEELRPYVQAFNKAGLAFMEAARQVLAKRELLEFGSEALRFPIPFEIPFLGAMGEDPEPPFSGERFVVAIVDETNRRQTEGQGGRAGVRAGICEEILTGRLDQYFGRSKRK